MKYETKQPLEQNCDTAALSTGIGVVVPIPSANLLIPQNRKWLNPEATTVQLQTQESVTVERSGA